VKFIRKALEANPNSPRAKKGMEWAMQRLGETPKAGISSDGGDQVRSAAQSDLEGTAKAQVKVREVKNPKKRIPILPILLILMGCAVFIFAAWSAVTSPVFASIMNIASTPQAQENPPFAQVNIAKPAAATQPMAQVIAPTVTAVAIPTEIIVVETPLEVATLAPTLEPTLEVVAAPTETPFSPPTAALPDVTSESGAVYAEIIADTPTPEFAEPTVAPYTPPQVKVGDGERWIDVDLSQQRLYAYEGDTLMNSFVVSTGTWQTPTVTGKFNIWVKVRSQAMTGPGYYLPDVPFVMYFYKDYGLHGTYWHNNFGTPMSHGCVNLATPDAEWLYNFASVGTVVNVHD
jgi:lipoprotein-anchoring transpeptidase ErfK/SrfK